MINWWREDLYLDWLEVGVITVIVSLWIVGVIYDYVIERRNK